MRVLLILLTLFAMTPSLAVASGYNDVQLADPKQEAAAKALMATIRCVVCQGQAIDESHADLAGDMRGMIRERIAKGEDPESIRAWLIEHYGDWVSFKPQLTARSLPLWIVPFLALLIGAFLMRGRFKKRAN
jgi:cytochrome c-type biogenesis protein CcmH